MRLGFEAGLTPEAAMRTDVEDLERWARIGRGLFNHRVRVIHLAVASVIGGESALRSFVKATTDD